MADWLATLAININSYFFKQLLLEILSDMGMEFIGL